VVVFSSQLIHVLTRELTLSGLNHSIGFERLFPGRDHESYVISGNDPKLLPSSYGSVSRHEHFFLFFYFF